MDLTQNLAQIIHGDDIYYCASFFGKSCGTADALRLEYCAIALVTNN